MIYLGSDHGGYLLKDKIKSWLDDWGYKYQDLGAHKLDPDDDYPQFAFAVAEKVSLEDNPTQAWKKRSKGILACRSAAGMVIAANKVKDVRAAAAFDIQSARHCREHNDANIIALSGDWLKETEAKKILEIWLETEFSKEARHSRRVQQIREKECCGCC